MKQSGIFKSSRLGFALWQAQHAVSRAVDERLRSLGISLTQAATLLLLRVAPGLSGAEIARQLGITPQSTATLLSQLEGRGWVTRRHHPVHRHVVETEITAAGNLLAEKAALVMDQADAAVAAGLTPEAHQALKAALEHCMQNAIAMLEHTGYGESPD